MHLSSMVSLLSFGVGFSVLLSRAGGQSPQAGPSQVTGHAIAMKRDVYDGPVSFATSLATYRGRLIVLDRKVTPHLTVVDLSTGNPIAKVGVHGTARGQLFAPACLRVESARDDIVSVAEQSRVSLLRIQLNTAGKSRLLSERAWPSVIPECAFQLGDAILVNAAFPDRVFYHVDAASGALGSRAVPPPFIGELPYNRKAAAVRPEGDRIAVAYRFLNRLEVFDAVGRRLGQFDGPVATEPRMTAAYIAVATTSRFIYAALCDCSLYDRSPRAREVHVFTWDGRLAARVTLDRGIHAFTVSENDSLLYASYGQVMHHRLGEWELPPLLRSGGARRVQ